MRQRDARQPSRVERERAAEGTGTAGPPPPPGEETGGAAAVVPRTARPGWVTWLTTTDHKQIGTLYLVSAFVFFLVGGVLALVMRAELA
ncbi:cytochrome ubiquinol oxidase subunit I, partial [Streptomyces sp. SID11233]|nr:cytochrome ubiquinol oxidase subunit I [Streptomyces sp. SID11233]